MRTVRLIVRFPLHHLTGLNYLHSYLAKVHLIEHHLVGMADAPEASDERQDCDHYQSKLVVPFTLHRLFCNALELVDFIFGVHDLRRLCVGRAALSSSLADSIGGHVWRIGAGNSPISKGK